MTQNSPLDDAETSKLVWARFRLIMRNMGALTAVIVVAAMLAIYFGWGVESPHFYIATAFGITAVMLLASALMGLAFMSDGTGHDESVVDPFKGRDKR